MQVQVPIVTLSLRPNNLILLIKYGIVIRNMAHLT